MKSILILSVLYLLSVCTFAISQEPVDVQSWSEGLQSIAAKYPKGKTQAQTNLARKKLVDELSKLDVSTVRMESSVKEVRWKDGVAEVYTELFIAPREPDAPVPPLRIVRIMPFELRMDEESAAAIEPGTKIEFQGQMVFHSGKWGAVGRTLKQQQLHTVNHIDIGGLPLGTYTSPDAKVTIEGKRYPNRWSS